MYIFIKRIYFSSGTESKTSPIIGYKLDVLTTYIAYASMAVTIRAILIFTSAFRLTVAHKSGHASHTHEHSALTLLAHHLQQYLFPFSARYNSLLATLLIQLIPCFIMLLIPALQNDGNGLVLSSLVSFALGTLFGDAFLHLIPEIFTSSRSEGLPVSIIQQRFLVLGSAIFGGFMLFLFLDKTLRVISIGTENAGNFSSHSHSHSHVQSSPESHSHISVSSHSTTTSSKNGNKKVVRQKKSKPVVDEKESSEPEIEETISITKNNSVVSAYLNIIAGFVHNLTDGIALASSFYSSKHVGVTTTIAIMFHEIPHELGDFAILLSGGFTFTQALKSHLITSMGALIGTAVGCALNEVSNADAVNTAVRIGWPTTLRINPADLMLPITAGGFIYIATVGVVPQVLQVATTDKSQEIKKWMLQLISISIGFGLMGALAMNE